MNEDIPKDIAAIIETLKKSSELGRNLEEAKIWDNWPGIVGSPHGAHSRPLGVRDRVLIIEVDSAVWMHKMSYDKPRILTQIRKIVPADLVEDTYLILAKDELTEAPEDTP